MSKEKIEEMANAINEMDEPNAHYYDRRLRMREAFADCFTMAKHLYNAGYRKQSKGEWVKSDIPQEKYVCSVCGGACWYYDYQGDVAKSRYCPNCGAHMRKEDENADR